MFKERSTEKLIEYIQTLPDREQKAIVKTLSSVKANKEKRAGAKTESDVLNGIKQGLREIKASKRTKKPLKTLDDFLNEI